LKRIITILLLFLFLLNALGFYAIFMGIEYHQARWQNARLDEDQYADDQAITIKVPLAVPYAADQEEFQRVTGEFEHEGEVYRLVKQKLTRDTLVVICVKDVTGKKIRQALSAYVKTFADHPINTKSQGKLLLTLLKDYLLVGIRLSPQSAGWSAPLAHGVAMEHNTSFINGRIEYPPEAISFC